MLRDNIVASLGNDGLTKILVAAANSLESANGISGVLKVASTVPELVIDDHELLDADPWLLNCPNGTVDPRTGQLHSHRPEDLLMSMTGAPFDPAATAPEFEQFLTWALPDVAVRCCVQEILGLALVGQQLEHLMLINLGEGSNGKSTLTTIIAEVLGDYAVAMNRKLLIAQRHSGHETITATLFRKRFAHAGELEAGSRLNESQVKELTGGDRINTRRMREDEWSFTPSHLLWLHANHRPVIQGTDHAIWRRVLLIEYPNTISGDDKDPHLAMRIAETEGVGVIAWLMIGLQRYLDRGRLEVPAVIRASTDDYRNESDTVHAFIEESGLLVNTLVCIDAGQLNNLHDEWFRDASVSGTPAEHYRKVTAWLRSRGCESKTHRGDGGRRKQWRGVGFTT
jgi:putative DNA primase/helicase